MKSKDKIILEKILKYIEELHDFIKSYWHEDFENDRKTINACVFNLSQIGELTNKVSADLINENPRHWVARIKVFKKSNCAWLWRC